MDRLRNTVMAYDWGSRVAIAALEGRPSPTPGPEAEVWIGTHASAPSSIDGAGASLATRIEAAPEAALGAAVRARFGDRLPFLLKVLAAATPLSLQAHPDSTQAALGFEREERAGIPATARHRNYKDTSHKPEILCALGPFEALCGFRPRRLTIELLEALAVPGLAPLLSTLRERPGAGGMRAAVEWVMGIAEADRRPVVAAVAAACAAKQAAAWKGELAWTARLAALYPDDVGVVVALLLNLVSLREGEAVYLPERTLHTYLEGTGVELMAASDNALRGGLTGKHVDVPELLCVLDYTEAPSPLVPTTQPCAHETVYETAAADFRLSRILLGQGSTCRPSRRGPELLLCVQGRAAATTEGGDAVSLGRGESAWIPAADAAYELAGEGVVFRATVGDARD